MDLLQALADIPKLIEDYKLVMNRLIQADKELAALKEDRYVGWDWICQYLGVTKPTAMQMLADEKMLVHGRQVKRILRSKVIRFAEKHSVRVRDVTE